MRFLRHRRFQRTSLVEERVNVGSTTNRAKKAGREREVPSRQSTSANAAQKKRLRELARMDANEERRYGRSRRWSSYVRKRSPRSSPRHNQQPDVPSSNLTLTRLYWVGIAPGSYLFLGMQAGASGYRARSVSGYIAMSLLLRAVSRARAFGELAQRMPDGWM